MLLVSTYSKHAFRIFLVAIFIILLPQFRIPFLNYDWADTGLLGRLLILLVFILFLAKNLFSKEAGWQKRSFYIDIVLLFFVIQSLSIIGAVNVPAFLKAYEKLVFGFMVFLITLDLAKQNKGKFVNRIILVFFLAGIIKLLMETLLYFAPDIFSGLADIFLKTDLAQYIKANLNRERTYIDFLNEISLPFFLYYFYKETRKKRKVLKFVGLSLGFLLGLIAFLSNWRGRFLVFVALSAASLIILRKFWTKKLAAVLLGSAILLVFFYVVDQNQLATRGFSVVDRLMNKDLAEDKIPVKWRFSVFRESVDMAQVSFFGVGLKNFYDWSESKSIAKFFRHRPEERTIDEASLHGPHNIFFQYLAETGFIGLTVFVLMLIVFLRKDIGLLNNPNLEETVVALAFWGLILATFFYPATTLGFYVSFFLFRALLV